MLLLCMAYCVCVCVFSIVCFLSVKLLQYYNHIVACTFYTCKYLNTESYFIEKNKHTRKARQSLVYSPLGTVVSPPNEYL